MSGSKKILMIISEFPPGPGGIGNHGFNLAKYFHVNGCDVKVMAVSDYVKESEEIEFDNRQNFPIHRFKRYDSRIKTFRERIMEIKQTLRSEKFTHVIFSGRFPLMTSLLLSEFNKDSKFIAIAHGGDVNPGNTAIRFLVNSALKKMDLIIPVSNFSKSKIGISLSESKVCVIPNGFDMDDFGSEQHRNAPSLNGSLNLITVGTIWPRKGHHNVLKALPKILSIHSNTVYKIIGREADTTLVKKYFEDKNLKNHLKIFGQVSNKTMIDELKHSQIFLMLSETSPSGDFEGFGIAVIEANYFGLPAIGSRNSGLEDAISHGVSGLLVDPSNPDEVAAAVETIVKDYSRFSEGARQWSLKLHWSEVIKKYLKAIDEIA